MPGEMMKPLITAGSIPAAVFGRENYPHSQVLCGVYSESSLG